MKAGDREPWEPVRNFLLSFRFPSFPDLLRKYVLGAHCRHSTLLSALENTEETEDDADKAGETEYLF